MALDHETMTGPGWMFRTRWLRGVSDRLNPVLVKELRTGLRTGAFVWAFLGVQACMEMLFVIHVGQRARDPSGRSSWVSSMVVWLILGTVFYLVFPLLGPQGFRHELRDRKLERLLYGSISLALSIGLSAARWSEIHSLFLMALVFCIPGLVVPIVVLGEAGLLAMAGAGLGVYVAAGLPLTFLGWNMALSSIEEHVRPG